jgi:hypothetical protein
MNAFPDIMSGAFVKGFILLAPVFPQTEPGIPEFGLDGHRHPYPNVAVTGGDVAQGRVGAFEVVHDRALRFQLRFIRRRRDDLTSPDVL